MRALVISNSDERDRWIGLLAQLGYSITQGSDIEEGLRSIGFERPDLVIASEEPPPQYASRITPALRGLGNVPVIIIGGDDVVAMSTALLQGADVYLRRPVSLALLQAHIRALMRRRYGTREYITDLKAHHHEIRDYCDILLGRTGRIGD